MSLVFVSQCHPPSICWDVQCRPLFVARSLSLIPSLNDAACQLLLLLLLLLLRKSVRRRRRRWRSEREREDALPHSSLLLSIAVCVCHFQAREVFVCCSLRVCTGTFECQAKQRRETRQRQCCSQAGTRLPLTRQRSRQNRCASDEARERERASG